MTFLKNLTTFLIITFLLGSCSHKTTTSVTGNDKASETSKNNLVVTKETNVLKKGTGDKIEFNGSNNLFDLIQKNAAFFDGKEMVIIVQGNNNIIKLYNRNLVDMSAPGMDTLLLIGNHTKYVMDVNNKIALKDKSITADTVVMKQKQLTSADFNKDFSETDNRIKYLTSQLATNDPEAFYELAKHYHYEIDNKQADLKAVELYEYAAAQNHIESIQKLGVIFANGTFNLRS